MRNATGYATIVGPDHPVIERDTITCGHCQQVVFTKPGSASTVYLIFDRATGHYVEEFGACCAICRRAICLQCHDHGHCVPWEKMIEAAESRDRLKRSV